MFLRNTNYVWRPNNSDSDLPSASVLAAGAGSFLPENDSYKVIKWWWRTEDRGRLILFSEGELFTQNIVKSAEEEEHRSEGWNTSAVCFLHSAAVVIVSKGAKVRGGFSGEKKKNTSIVTSRLLNCGQGCLVHLYETHVESLFMGEKNIFWTLWTQTFGWFCENDLKTWCVKLISVPDLTVQLPTVSSWQLVNMSTLG